MHRFISTALFVSLFLWCNAAPAAEPKTTTKTPPTAEEVRTFEETKKLAESGNADAEYRLAQLYSLGSGVTKSDDEAAKWYRKSAERGDARGQSMLGVFYTNARGVPRNYDEAIKWFMKAAAQNSSHAMYNLGHMHGGGKGVKKDDVESAKWYAKAAEQNDRTSQRVIGSLYALGRGVPKDLVLAHAWMTVSGSATTEAGAKALEKIAAEMTPEQLAAAKKQAEEIKARVAKPKH